MIDKECIKDVVWFTEHMKPTCIGIVKVQFPDGHIVFYIGTGQGLDEEEDKQHIANYGVKFYPEFLERFLGDNNESI